MYGSGPQTNALVAGVGPGQRAPARPRRRALHRFQPVQHEQPVRRLRGQLAQLAAEDHRALVAVGVDQHDLAAALRPAPTCRMDMTGVIPLPAGEQQEVVVQRLRA